MLGIDLIAKRSVRDQAPDFEDGQDHPKVLRMKLPENLIKIMKAKGLSLSSLSRKSGVPKSTLAAWTKGRETLNVTQIKKVADVLGVDLHTLIFGEPDPNSAADTDLVQMFSGDIRVTVHKILKKKPKEGS